MLGWFKPRCPLETWEKTWTETRMLWLARTLGIERLRRAEVIVPRERHFPEPYLATDEDAHRLTAKLCGWMGVDPARIRVVVKDDQKMGGGALGIYEKHPNAAIATIHVNRSQFDDAQGLVATLAHELAHQILLGDGLIEQDVLAAMARCGLPRR